MEPKRGPPQSLCLLDFSMNTNFHRIKKTNLSHFCSILNLSFVDSSRFFHGKIMRFYYFWLETNRFFKAIYTSQFHALSNSKCDRAAVVALVWPCDLCMCGSFSQASHVVRREPNKQATLELSEEAASKPAKRGCFFASNFTVYRRSLKLSHLAYYTTLEKYHTKVQSSLVLVVSFLVIMMTGSYSLYLSLSCDCHC